MFPSPARLFCALPGLSGLLAFGLLTAGFFLLLGLLALGGFAARPLPLFRLLPGLGAAGRFRALAGLGRLLALGGFAAGLFPRLGLPAIRPLAAGTIIPT